MKVFNYTKEEVRESELVTKKAGIRGIRNEALYKKEKKSKNEVSNSPVE